MCTRIVLTIFFLSSLSVNCLAGETPKSQISAEKDGFVLFPGGSQADGLEWQRVVPQLSLPALAMEMPHGATANTTRDEYIGWVLRAIDRAGLRRVILVGHSGGGLIVPQIAIKAPERVRHMVFVSANVPPEGGTVLDVLPISLVGFITWQLGPKYRLFWWWQRRTLCNDCDDQTWAFTKKHYDVTWNTLYSFSSIPSERERVTRKGLSPSIPRTYIKLLRDNALPPKWQDKAAANIGAQVVTLDSGHMAPLTHPTELAAILNSIAAKDQTR
jgi:pimeloyl-ACP methyl ester carboxylesterase